MDCRPLAASCPRSRGPLLALLGVSAATYAAGKKLDESSPPTAGAAKGSRQGIESQGRPPRYGTMAAPWIS